MNLACDFDSPLPPSLLFCFPLYHSSHISVPASQTACSPFRLTVDPRLRSTTRSRSQSGDRVMCRGLVGCMLVGLSGWGWFGFGLTGWMDGPAGRMDGRSALSLGVGMVCVFSGPRRSFRAGWCVEVVVGGVVLACWFLPLLGPCCCRCRLCSHRRAGY